MAASLPIQETVTESGKDAKQTAHDGGLEAYLATEAEIATAEKDEAQTTGPDGWLGGSAEVWLSAADSSSACIFASPALQAYRLPKKVAFGFWVE